MNKLVVPSARAAALQAFAGIQTPTLRMMESAPCAARQTPQSTAPFLVKERSSIGPRCLRASRQGQRQEEEAGSGQRGGAEPRRERVARFGGSRVARKARRMARWCSETTTCSTPMGTRSMPSLPLPRGERGRMLFPNGDLGGGIIGDVSDATRLRPTGSGYEGCRGTRGHKRVRQQGGCWHTVWYEGRGSRPPSVHGATMALTSPCRWALDASAQRCG